VSFSCTPCLGSEATLLLNFLNQCSEIGLEVNSDKTKNMFKSRDQNAGRSYNIRIGNKPFETVEGIKYLGTNLTNENSV